MNALEIFMAIVAGLFTIEMGCFMYLHLTDKLNDDDYNPPIGG